MIKKLNFFIKNILFANFIIFNLYNTITNSTFALNSWRPHNTAVENYANNKLRFDYNSNPSWKYLESRTDSRSFISEYCMPCSIEQLRFFLNDITKTTYWFFKRGNWIYIKNNNISIIININYSQVSFYQLFFVSIVIISIIYSLWILISSKSVQQALISFFTYIIIMSIFLFYMTSDYVATIVVIVYSGAILIFFAFVLFTMDPKWFFSQSGFSFGKTFKYNSTIKQNKYFFFIVNFFNVIGIIFFFINGDFSCVQPNFFNKIITTNIGFQIFGGKKSHQIFIFGEFIFSDFWIATTALAILLLIILVLSIIILNFTNEFEFNKKPSFWKNFFFFKTWKK